MTLVARPAANVTFTPVKVVGGRKYRGTGFVVGYSTSVGDYGWRHTGYGWARNIVETTSARIWVPELKRFKWANEKFVEVDETVSQQQRDDELQKYCDHILADTIDWCRKTRPGVDEAEVLRFARNVLRKNHPEIDVDATIPDGRDPATEIHNTVAWALTLKTRPCWMYGRYCAGGKPLSGERYVSIARKALVKRGISSMDGFEALFKAELQKVGLPC